MSKRLFIKIASDNIKKNRKVYMPYTLTGVGIIMIFYIITNLALDNDIAKFWCGETLVLTLRLGQIVVGVFAVLFMFYSNSFLMKRRKTELGLYSVLGMGKRHIAMVLAWENILIWTKSTLLGIVSGVIFGKLAETTLIRMIGGNILYDFNINLNAALITAAFFVVLFFSIFISSAVDLVRTNTIDLLYSSSKGEKEPKANYLIAIAGIVLLSTGYIIAIKVETAVDAIVSFFIAVLLVIVGTYCCMISGSTALLKTLKKNKKYYYKTSHFISTSSMIFRMKKHGAGLAAICILSTMVLVMISSTACLYIGAEDGISKQYPRDVELNTALYCTDTRTIQAVEKGMKEIRDAVSENNHLVTKNHMDYIVCDYYGKIEEKKVVADLYGDAQSTKFVLVTIDDYNRNFGKKENLQENEVLISSKGMNYSEDEIYIEGEKYSVKGEAKDLIKRGIDEAELIDTLYIVLPKRTDLLDIYNKLDASASELDYSYVSLEYCRGFDLLMSDGKLLTEDYLLKLSDDFYRRQSQAGNEEEFYGENASFKTAKFNVRVKTDGSALLGIYGGLFFLGILLSIMFTGALIIIMYYKQVEEGYDDCNRFEILRKVGMSVKEIRTSINYQVLAVFFIPLVGTALHMAFAFHIISLLINAFGVFNTPLLIATTVGSFLTFAVIYIAAYIITSKAYYRIVANVN